MRNKMVFSDLCVSREIKALDKAWEEFVSKLYLLTFNAASDTVDVEKRSCYMSETVDEIERARVLYLEERDRLKGKFGKKDEEIARLSDIARSGYVLSNRECEAAKKALNKRFGCVDEIAEDFADDHIVNAVTDERNMTKKPNTIVTFNKHDDVKGSTCDGLEEFIRGTLKEDE